MSPTGERRDERRNIRTRQNPLGPQERQTRISKAILHLNNFTEQLTDDEDEDSAPFSLESTNDANKQPLTPPIYHLPSPQDVFVPLPQTQRNQSQRGNEENVFLLKDLFSTMRSFTGNDNYSVKAFFRDVEENFIFIPHISDLQKIICVKRLLQGPAKTFIQTLHNILTYSSLKAALIEEFEDLFSSYDVHKEMQKRKLRPTESLFEYFLAMREIASKAHFHLDDHSLIMYCITGIPDSNHNKLILYACKSISEFKEKLKIYEKVFMQNNSYCIDNENKRTKFKQYDFPTSNKNMCSDNKFHNKDQFYDANVNKRDERIRCYNCGLFNHTSNECYHKNKGLKCFNCNQFGHKSSQCVFKKPEVKNEIVNEVVSEVVNEINSSSEMRKTVKINGYDFDALIDTGSTITLIRESVYQILGRPTLNATKIKLTSFNKLHKLEESNLEKVEKLVKLEEKYEILQETLKITEQRLVEKEIECASLTEKILIVNTQTESNDHPKTSMSTKEREINPSKRKTKKSKSSGRNANKNKNK
ncbi:retrovirus-related Pol polyprotein from transposon 17.6 [Trichonephila clavipes]|nr:retrovirus-related Pol polyprotein from transposon 17.6 [Trichonephila clavipes]